MLRAELPVQRKSTCSGASRTSGGPRRLAARLAACALDRLPAIDCAFARGQESLPLHALGVLDPVLLAVRVAAHRLAFIADRTPGVLDAREDFGELGAILDLNAEVPDADDPVPAADREVDARVFQHPLRVRSEERRVGKECRSRWSPYQ